MQEFYSTFEVSRCLCLSKNLTWEIDKIDIVNTYTVRAHPCEAIFARKKGAPILGPGKQVAAHVRESLGKDPSAGFALNMCGCACCAERAAGSVPLPGGSKLCF